MNLTHSMFFFYVTIFIDSWVIFSKSSGIKLSWKRLCLTGLMFIIANMMFDNLILIDQFFFIIVSLLFAPQKKLSEHIFNGFFAIMIVELLFRVIGSFFLPVVIGFTISQINNDLRLLELCYLCVLPMFYLFSYIFSIDLSLLRFISEDKMKKWVFWMNTAMFSYYFFVHFLVNVQSDFLSLYFRCRSMLIFIYLAILIWVVVKLDRFAKDQLSQKLVQAQNERIGYLENYNHSIEQLYQEIRTVKHDSENILISLKDSIDSGDMTSITQVYETVIQQSATSMMRNSYEVSSLDNIQEAVIRSVMNSKLLEAQHYGIKLYIDIPDVIDDLPIKLLDLIVLFTGLVDNAIETAKGSRRPFLSIAYFKQDGKQFFIIENSTKTNRINMARLFNVQQKSLSRFFTILNGHPQITFSTKSDHYRLRQLLEMR
ncbi:UNVERIFIED_CONTAM: sensor histidine kinase [Streptococcus canis]|uniref:Histidine kinase n=2 Tax=Streptococcus TaxID=1301 RepID=A0AAV3FUF7_STRCB|nr:sensor histidine kinase [Streptococcus canis]EIQ82785.1 Putative histidine kinase [Streptococcus canis FSL Z3-227]MDV5988464.1 sensor histidine kinase [Streptococcus canis]MDV5992938.1 sensor histidine kinase [Streptococcus canis]MDV6002113.1 sensor histidine kinase [Streptococcus canis]MDV6022134.1 sensor histidine kinase [Streptococcus canis]